MGEQPEFPFEFKELEPEVKEKLARLYTTQPDFVSVGPKGYKLLRPYCGEAKNIYNLPVRPQDTFVITFQRSGTTWTQELVWLLANDLDYVTANEIPLSKRFTFLDVFMFLNKKWQENYLKTMENKKVAQAFIDYMAKPVTEELLAVPEGKGSFIKTHLPMSLLPPKLLDTAKVLYVARDPRDVAVSSFHHAKLFKVMDFPNPFKDFWNLFIQDSFSMTPYFEHVKEAWEQRHHPNMLFLFYEELSKDLPSVVRRVADFMGKALTAEQINRLCDHLSFKNFKNNPAINFEEVRELGILAPEETFIRKGKAGGWREYFDEEMTQQAEQWFADNLRDTDLRFPDILCNK